MKTEYLEITAAAGGRKPSVKGVAYSGGKMRLFEWSRPVVVDMAGMSVPETVPLLANHENHTLGRVEFIGDGAPWVENIAADGFEDAIFTLDCSHAFGSVSKVCEFLAGDAEEATKAWKCLDARREHMGCGFPEKTEIEKVK